MFVSLRSFWLPKAGHTATEYEDAFWPQISGRLEGYSLRFAMADGATESSFSRLWSRMLVSLYCSPLTPLPVDELGLERFRCRSGSRGEKWLRKVLKQPLPWFALEKVEQGAFSALLGLSLEEDRNRRPGQGRWSAFAIGDTLLYQLREGKLLTSFPLTRADEFGYHPLLLSTNSGRNQTIWEQGADRLKHSGLWQTGDVFLLMTDALAHWFLSRWETEDDPWRTLKQGASSNESFAHWITDMRALKEIRNDDVTLFIIEIGEP